MSDPSPSLNGDQITFIRSRMHVALDPTAEWDAAGNTLESHWPEHHNNLLVAQLEHYLAKKDGRKADVALINGDIAALEGLFFDEITSDNQGVAARWGRRSPHMGEG